MFKRKHRDLSTLSINPMVLVSYTLFNILRSINANDVGFLGLQSSYDSSTLGGVTSLRGEESRMMTVEFITALFYEVDEQLPVFRAKKGCFQR